jgi:phage gp36-like protein
MIHSFSAHSHSATHPLEVVQAELLKIYCDIAKYESAVKQKESTRKKYLARRAIELHKEKLALKQSINDAWQE